MQSETSVYQQRKEQGLCTRCGAAAADDSLLCPEHRDEHRVHKSEWIAKMRAQRVADGLCVWCPASGPPMRVKSGETSCLACRIRRRRLPVSDEGVENDVDKRRTRIAAATRKHADGRERYHGQQRRGQQTHAQLNRQDIGMAVSCFDAFRAGIQLLGSDEAKAWSRGERDSVVKATANQGERASRHIDDVLERLGHFKQRHGRRAEMLGLLPRLFPLQAERLAAAGVTLRPIRAPA